MRPIYYGIIVILFVASQRLMSQEKVFSSTIATRSNRLLEACKLRKLQTGRFPSTISDLTTLLSPDFRASIPGKPEFRDPDSRDMRLKLDSPIGNSTPWLRIQLEEDKSPTNLWLNVSCDGSIFFSFIYWESECVHLQPLKFAITDRLLRDLRSIPARLQPRSSLCSKPQLDLASHATADPNQPWMTRLQWDIPDRPSLFPEGDNIDALSQLCGSGTLTFSNRLFDVRGVVHLDGATGVEHYWMKGYPTATSNITVEAVSPRLHVLGGTFQRASPETKVLSVWLHYADGQTAELPIRYGVEVADARFPTTARSSLLYPPTPIPQLPDTEGGAVPSLFYFVLENPHPAKHISSLRLVSAQTSSHPYVLAITLD